MRLLNLINPYHLSDTIRKKEPLAVQREIILQFLLDGVTVWGIFGLAQYLLRTRIAPDNLILIVPFIITIVIQVVITLARRLPYRVRAISLAVLILIESMTSLYRAGLSGNGMVYGLAFVAVIAVLISPRMGFYAGGGFVLVQALVGWAMVTGRMKIPDSSLMTNSGTPSAWFSSALAVLLVASSLSAAFFLLTRGLSSALDNQKRLTSELEKERDLLETRVNDRTQQLSRKAAQLEAAQQVAAALASETDMNLLLTTAVDVIKEKFGFYHAGIFLNDPQNTDTILAASTGAAGQAMLANGHRLRIGAVGIVGYVAARGEPRVTSDVVDDPNYYPNPYLPETRAEMAVPLRSGDKTIGVLDIQSTYRDAFTPDDLEIISTIANQLTLALEKARLMKDLETSLAELENNVRQSTATTWKTHIRASRRRYAFQYKHALVQNASIPQTIESIAALQKGSTVITPAKGVEQKESIMAVPIKLRNQTVGVINMRISSAKVSPELVRLVENAVNRLAMSLENVRLLEELQVRAERERMVGEISSKVRAATDVDTILRTAANEIGRSLGVSEVVVQLNTVK
jgi:GAF domain-containing protein